MQWLDSVERIVSPNADDRSLVQEVDLLVVHSISLPPGQYDNNCVERFFQNRLDPAEHPYFEEISSLKVSAHLYIKRDGKVVQFVPLDKRAWHAGLSCWQGRERCNDFSIGIELEGCDTDDFTDDQYQALEAVTREIQKSYPKISRERIVGHSDISPGRKTDPGPGFDWQRYLDSLDS